MYNIWGKINYVDESNICHGTAGGWYIPYFKQIDSSSSTSRWAKQPYDIDQPAEGYHSFHLEDYDVLTSEGSYRKGTDRIYIPYFWNENNIKDKDINSSDITHIAFYDHLIRAGEDDTELNFCLAPVKTPTVTYSFPLTEVKTNTNLTMAETSSLNEYKVTPNGCGKKYTSEITQLNTHNGIVIFKNYKLVQSIFDWGDESIVTVDKTGNGTTNSVHKYAVPGKYNIKIRVNTGFNSSFSEKTQQITVRYNEPIVDFKWISSNGLKGQEAVTFENITTNAPDNRHSLYTYAWEISDKTLSNVDASVSFIGKPFSFSPVHNFKSPGVKTIKLTCNWNDGIENKTTVKTYTLTITKYSTPILDFTWSSANGIKGNNEILFTNTSTKDAQDARPIDHKYDWTLYDFTLTGTASDYTINTVLHNYAISYVYKSPGNKQIKLICNWNDGFEDQQIEKLKSFALSEFTVNTLFTWDKVCKNRAESVTFANQSTGDVSKIKSYKWDIEDSYPAPTESFYVFSQLEPSRFNEGSPDNTQEVVNNRVFTTSNAILKFHSSKKKKIKLAVTYFSGWEDKVSVLEKEYSPIEYYMSAKLAASTLSPIGRKTAVEFINSTIDPDKLQYFYDLSISDFYSICNIDNDTSDIKDNSKEYKNTAITAKITHAFQNIDTNNVDMRVYFDNGWGRVYADTNISIKPKKFILPVANFNWDIVNVYNRNTPVTFVNTSIDTNKTITKCSWNIIDEYDIYNPDNPTYGVSITDNSKQYKNVNFEYTPIHKFQSNKQHNITLNIEYDDGFCLENTSISKVLTTKNNVNVEPDFMVYFNSQIVTGDTAPGNELKYTLVTDKSNIKSVHWEFNDVNYIDGSDNITQINSIDDILFVWKYSTRKPLCINGILDNVEKCVSMYVIYDNGWIDTNISNTIQKKYNVLTNELNDIKLYADNSEYPEDMNIYGAEKVHIYNTFTQLFNLDTIFEWKINEFMTSDEHFQYSFINAGEQTIQLTIYFDDGFGNIYDIVTQHKVNILKYLKPDLDFIWEDTIDLFIGSEIKFTSINTNTQRPYASINYLKVDYYNDGTFDLFDIDGDGEYESDTLPVNTVWWNIFEKNVDPLNIRIVGYWNDGFSENIIEIVKPIILLELPPKCILDVLHISNNKYKLNINTESVSADLQYKFDAYLKSPVIDTDKCKDINDMESLLPICSVDNPFGSEYFLIYTSNWIEFNEKWISVAASGKYKIIGYVRNSSGESFAEKYFEIEPTSGTETVIKCSRQCITGVVKKYIYQTMGEKKW